MSSPPPPTRETISTGLFAILQTLTPSPFKTVSRKLKLWSEVAFEEQPAMFMTEHNEHPGAQPPGLPPNRVFKYKLFIYQRVEDTELGSLLLNNLLDAIDGALKTATSISTNKITLGNRVYQVWVDGEVTKDPGDLDNQALALYQISVRGP